MMTKTIFVRGAASAAALGLILALGAGTALAQPKPGGAPAPNAGLPNPRIVVIDRQAILGLSKVAQDIVRQVNGYRQSAETQFRAEGQALEKEGRALQQQVAILAPDVKAKKIRDFQAKIDVATSPGATSGSRIRTKAPKRVVPSTIAASSSSFGTPSMNPRSVHGSDVGAGVDDSGGAGAGTGGAASSVLSDTRRR